MNILSRKYQPKRFEYKKDTKSISEIKSLMSGKSIKFGLQSKPFEMSDKAKYFRPETPQKNIKLANFVHNTNDNVLPTRKLNPYYGNDSKLNEISLFSYVPTKVDAVPTTFDLSRTNESTLADVEYFNNETFIFTPQSVESLQLDKNTSDIVVSPYQSISDYYTPDVSQLNVNTNQSITNVNVWNFTTDYVLNRPNVSKFVTDNNMSVPENIITIENKTNESIVTVDLFNANTTLEVTNVSEYVFNTNQSPIQILDYDTDNNSTEITLVYPTLKPNLTNVLINEYYSNVVVRSEAELTYYVGDQNISSPIEISKFKQITNDILALDKIIGIGINALQSEVAKRLRPSATNIIFSPLIKEYTKSKNDSVVDNKEAKLFKILDWYNDAIKQKSLDSGHNSAAIQYSNLSDITNNKSYTEYLSNSDAKQYNSSVNYFKSSLTNKYSYPTGYVQVRDVNQRNETTIDKITNLGVGEDYGNLEDLIPFKFQNYEKTDNLIFRASINGLSDSFTGNWDEIEYIGRADNSYQYSSYSRSIGFGFVVMIGSKHEFKNVWKKLNHLAKYTTPKYINNRKTGNLMRLTIGDLWRDMVGFLGSVSYSFSDDVAWEINPFNDPDLKKLPRHIEVSVEYTPISTYRPEFDSNVYDFVDNW